MNIRLTKALSWQGVDATGRELRFKKDQTKSVDKATGMHLMGTGMFEETAPNPSGDIPQATSQRESHAPLENELPDNLQGKTVLAAHGGGIGDILFTTPTLAAIKAMDPSVQIDAVIPPKMEPLLEGNPNIRKLLDRETARAKRQTYAAVLNFTGCIASNPEAKQLHVVQATALWVGITLRKASLELHAREQDAPWAERRLSQAGITDEPTVAICVSASPAHKRWPPAKGAILAKTLSDMGYGVILVGQGETIPAKGEKILDMVGQTTLRQLIVLLTKVDLYVGPDSGPLYIAEALKKPCVGLFGPHPHELYIEPGGPVSPMSARITCSPCGATLPKGCKNWTSEGQESACMSAINPKTVMERINQLLPLGAVARVQ